MLSLPTLSLYIHFPWCVHKCPYCDFNSHVLKKDLPEKEYIQALLRDFESAQPYIQGRTIDSIYLGGGTPSLFSHSSIAYLFQKLRLQADILKDAEVTIEANPESVHLEKLAGYREVGINRISLGVQSLQDVHLKKLGRAHDSLRALQAIEAIKQADFTNFNLDLMYGLPDQTEQAGLEDIQKALKWNPTHVSWYQLTLEPNTAFFKRPPILPCEDTVMDLQLQGSEVLMQAGLIPYEISAWSRPGLECRHNTNYWTFGDYIGIGAGAHSKVTQPSKGEIIRYWNYASPRRYLSGETFFEGTETITREQLPFEFMLNSLRLYKTITRQLFESHTGLAWEVLIPYFEKATDKGLLTWEDQSLTVTPFGRRFYNSLVSLFL